MAIFIYICKDHSCMHLKINDNHYDLRKIMDKAVKNRISKFPKSIPKIWKNIVNFLEYSGAHLM